MLSIGITSQAVCKKKRLDKKILNLLLIWPLIQDLSIAIDLVNMLVYLDPKPKSGETTGFHRLYSGKIAINRYKTMLCFKICLMFLAIAFPKHQQEPF